MTFIKMDNNQDLFQLINSVQISTREGLILSINEGMNLGAELLIDVRQKHRKVILIGNGGSAAIVDHIQTDLLNSLKIRGLTFNNPALLTALSNDYGYSAAFESMVNLWADEEDLLLAISSSGKSENIIRAVKSGIDMGLKVITLSGFQPDNPLRFLGNLNFYISNATYGLVETAHSILAHQLTDITLGIIKSQQR
jgi:D-sedoheptulose 7-phosphate isomerase